MCENCIKYICFNRTVRFAISGLSYLESRRGTVSCGRANDVMGVALSQLMPTVRACAAGPVLGPNMAHPKYHPQKPRASSAWFSEGRYVKIRLLGVSETHQPITFGHAAPTSRTMSVVLCALVGFLLCTISFSKVILLTGENLQEETHKHDLLLVAFFYPGYETGSDLIMREPHHCTLCFSICE